MIKEDIDKIVKIIDEDYYFWDNYEQWIKIKRLLNSIERENISFYNVRKLVEDLKDPHLAIKNVNRNKTVPFCLVEKENMIFKKDEYQKRIYSINSESIENILLKYKNDYPKQYMNYLNDDIGNGHFLLNDVMEIYFEDGSNEIVKSLSISEVIEKFGLHEICNRNIFYKNMENGFFVVKIPFIRNESMIDELKSVMTSKEFESSTRIIIDLRDNRGGRIDIAKQIVELCFEGKYEFPYLISDSLGTMKKLVVHGKKFINLDNKKIYIFVNSNTMSAAEFILTIALKDIFCKNAIIIGEVTAGLA